MNQQKSLIKFILSFKKWPFYFQALASGLIFHTLCYLFSVQSFLLWALAVVCGAYAPSYLDGAEYTAEGRYWEEFARHPVWNKILAYLPATIHYEVPLDISKQYFFCSHPHGPASMHHLMMLCNGAGFHDNASAGSRRRDLSAGIIFKIPIYREICLWLGTVSADRHIAQKILSKGWSTVSLVGGIQEQILAQKGKHEVFITKRNGFVRLALEHGVPIVPIYTFGETDLYFTSNFLKNLRMMLVNKLRLPIPLFWGPKWYFPLFPRQVPVTMCVGRPIEVPKIENPSNEDVNKWHQLYIQELQRIFEINKERLGYGAQSLIIR